MSQTEKLAVTDASTAVPLYLRIVRTSLTIIILTAFAYFGYQYELLQIAYDNSSHDDAMLSAQLATMIAQFQSVNSANSDLKTVLQARVQENGEKDSQVQQLDSQNQVLSSAVQTLDKLATTDKELLEKYSSVYFLNENYVPASLAEIPAAYLARPDKPEQFLAPVMTHLTALLADASTQHAPLLILSAYRSFQTQMALKTGYKMTYGTGTANSFSADQGYSEHQLGTAVDFTTPALAPALSGFDQTSSYAWLLQNAYKYGFVISYPKGNGYFVFEPWHWRYVGVDLATQLHNDNKYFYDLDQRSIDTYLIKFFD